MLGEYNSNNAHAHTINLEEKFAISVLEDSSYIPSIDLEASLFDRINQLTEEINFYKSNPQYLDICEEITKIETKIENKEMLISKCDGLVIDYKSSIKSK